MEQMWELLAGLGIFALLLNLPFGAWRKREKKFSLEWWLAIHIPVPCIVALRLFLHLPLKAIPVLVTASVAGQILGGRISRKPAL